MKILVTGANGHIGSNTVRELLASGYKVRAMVRQGSDCRGLEELEIEYVYGDITDREAVVSAAQDCNGIIHLAAVYKTIAKTPDEIIQPAVIGAENIFAAAKQAGIKRVVYTSSIASIGFSYNPDQLRTNKDWNEEAHNPYYVAKTESERIAQKLAKEYGIEIIVICPAIVLGGYDYRITPSNQLVMDWINGVGQTYKGGLCLVDVRDIAEAEVAALTKGENGKRYIVGGENMEVKTIGMLIKSLTGVKPIHLPTSRKLTLVFARIVESVCRWLGLKPPFTYDLVYEVVERYSYYDTHDTELDLDIRPRPAREALISCIRWLLETGKIKDSKVDKIQSNLPEV